MTMRVEDKQDGRDNERHYQYCCRVSQGFLDLLLDRLGFFLVGGDLVEQCFECTGLLTGFNEVDEQIVEIKWLLGERFRQRATALDVGLDAQYQLLHGGVFVAGADDLECLYERDTGCQHRGELAAENGDIAGRDL
jgi:hypothetical protein